ncbi:amino acid ABC transporter substrate-binding protein [Schumannella sp. 10F1B-5-1]|uniref:amino acid ABC transporter substrate-binding protein n=1 Tax=Schumannella sp. 10F1B-5-1 TaxID=2590780 RepID=UPI0011302094|nr:amino acid ABC transporter substrate-binding protein [Schumannella sp. 10F1B-5-1]TPW78468.1 amino acid ABC transporter substrate-binding protein [Schumannella sp. 10F1B-5-1]
MRTRIRVRHVLVAATAAAALLLAGCSTSGTGSSSAGDPSAEPKAGRSLAQVQDAGELVVATEGTYRPFSYHADGSGDLTGYDVEVITAVAQKLGVKVKFQETQWDAIFAGLDAGRFDVIANQVSINAEREKKYEFSTPYSVSPGAVIVRDDSDITSLADLKGKTTAQSLTSNWYEVAQKAGANVEQVEGWAQAIELLKQQRVDATVNDKLTFLDAKKNGETDGLKIAADTDDVSKSAVALRQGSDTLTEAIDTALAELKADGTLAKLGEKYFGEDISG